MTDCTYFHKKLHQPLYLQVSVDIDISSANTVAYLHLKYNALAYDVSEGLQRVPQRPLSTLYL